MRTHGIRAQLRNLPRLPFKTAGRQRDGKGGAIMKVRDIEMVGNTLWCGTTTGILRIALETMESTVIPSYDIRAVSYCQDRIWFGSFGGGLMAIDPQDTALTVVYAETFHDIILSMAADSANLWFCSELDIAQLNLETGMLYYYNALDGEPNSYFTEAEAVITPEGKILFGYSNGYVSTSGLYHPDRDAGR